MANDISRSADSLPFTVAQSQVDTGPGVGIEPRQIVELLQANKWPIAGVTCIFFLLGALYCLLIAPTYRTTGLVQVENQSGASFLNAALGDLSSSLLNAGSESEAEIQLLKSRMVIGEVVEKMNLAVQVRPNYFPLVGAAIARWNSKAKAPVAAPPGLAAFAWGGERIEVTTFVVPDSLLDRKFRLTVTPSGYHIENSDGPYSVDGKVGEMLKIDTPDGPINIFVRVLSARTGEVFTIKRRPLQDVLDALGKTIKIEEQGKQSGVIQIAVKGPSPAMVYNVLDGIEDAYVRQNVEHRSSMAQQSLEFLSKQLPQLKEKVDIAQTNLNNYQLRHGTVDVTEETSGVLKQSEDLESKRLELEQQRQLELQRFTPEHPVIKAIDDQLKVLETAQANIKKDIESLPTTQQDVLSLMRDLDVATQLYTTMLDTMQQLQITKAGTIGNVRIVDHPLRPYKPISPQPLLLLPLVAFMGFFVGSIYILVKRALLRGVDDPMEIERNFGLATYASIPYSRVQRHLAGAMRHGARRDCIITATESDSETAEAFRSLRTSLHFALLESSSNVIMITGPVPGIGKSYLAVNLATVLALAGKKIVVVDADMRRGYLHQYFGADPKPGLADFLADNADAASIQSDGVVPGLRFIPRGATAPNPSELLMKERFQELINELSSQYDYVILDAPPVLPVADAMIMGRVAGCTLVALKSAEHSMREVEETIKRLAAARVAVRGVIFNQVGLKVGSHGYGNYRYGSYGYHSD